jgi:CBS domain-containing protein
MREYIVDPFETMRVADIMAQPVDTLPASMPVKDAVSFFTAPDAPARHKSYPVVDGAGHLKGMVARADVLRWTRDGWPAGQSLADVVGDSDCISGFSDELVGQLADRMAAADAGRVPILQRSTNIVIGLVARRDLLRVRAAAVGHERERKALIQFRKFQPSTDA